MRVGFIVCCVRCTVVWWYVMRTVLCVIEFFRNSVYDINKTRILEILLIIKLSQLLTVFFFGLLNIISTLWSHIMDCVYGQIHRVFFKVPLSFSTSRKSITRWACVLLPILWMLYQTSYNSTTIVHQFQLSFFFVFWYKWNYKSKQLNLTLVESLDLKKYLHDANLSSPNI